MRRRAVPDGLPADRPVAETSLTRQICSFGECDEGLMTNDPHSLPAENRRGSDSPVLRVADLSCEIRTDDGIIRPVDHVSFEVRPGTTLGIVGESGAGKSMLARAVMGIAPRSASVSGQVFLNSAELTGLSRRERQRYLGSGIGIIFKDAISSLNPVVPVGRRLTEVMRFHLGIGQSEAHG